MQQIPADDVVLMGDPRVAEIPVRETHDELVDVCEVSELALDPLKPPQLAPHVSGAAIDLTMTDGSGQAVDMGTPINATPEDSAGGVRVQAAGSAGRAGMAEWVPVWSTRR